MNQIENDPCPYSIYYLLYKYDGIKIPDLQQLYKPTFLLLLVQRDKKMDSQYFSKANDNFLKDYLKPQIPSILVFNFYEEKENPIFFILVFDNFIFIVEYEELSDVKVMTKLSDFFRALQNKTVFIPISEKDQNNLIAFFPDISFQFCLNVPKQTEDNEVINTKYEKALKSRSNDSFFQFDPTKIPEEYPRDKLLLISYKVRLTYCINLHFYDNQKIIEFNENFEKDDFLEIQSFGSLLCFSINRNDFSPYYINFMLDDNHISLNFNNIIEFHKNFHFFSLLPACGCIRSKGAIVYKYMNNKTVIMKNGCDFLNDEIRSSILFRVSAAILFLHSNNFVHRQIRYNYLFLDSEFRAYVGQFSLLLKEGAEDEYSKTEFAKKDEHNEKRNDVWYLKENIISQLFKEDSPIHSLLEKVTDIYDVFRIIMKNNLFYNGSDIQKLKSLLFNNGYFDNCKNSDKISFGDVKNCIDSLQMSNELTLINHLKKFNDIPLFDIQVIRLKNRILEKIFISMFVKVIKTRNFAVFGFIKKENQSVPNYFCLCVEKYYFLINSYFLFDLKIVLEELSKLILIPVSIEAKNTFQKMIEKSKNGYSFTFFNDNDIASIEQSIILMSKVCNLSLIENKNNSKNEKLVDFSDDDFIQCIQITNRFSKYIENNDFVLPLLGYFMQRIFFDSKYFQDPSFFEESSNLKKSILESSKKNQLSLNDFQIIKLIGSGASSRVYLAIHINTFSFVALKIYDSNKNDSFLREKTFFEKSQNHPYIIEYYGSFSDKDNKGILLLDFKSNGSISDLFKSNENSIKFCYKPKNLSEFDLIAKLFLNLLFALHHLHYNLNCVYQDLTPDNIIIDHNFDLFLTDFESAIYLDSDKQNESSFWNDLLLFGKIVFYICERNKFDDFTSIKDISLSQISDPQYNVLNFILSQCDTNIKKHYSSTHLFIHEIQLIGFLFPSNDRQLFSQIFEKNSSLINDSVFGVNNDLIFNEYVSSDNKKLISYFYKYRSEIRFASFVIASCYKNGLFVEKNHEKARKYYDEKSDKFEILSIFIDDESPRFLEIDKEVSSSYERAPSDSKLKKSLIKIKYKIGTYYFKQGKFKEAKSFFEEGKKLLENHHDYYFIAYSYKLAKLEELKTVLLKNEKNNDADKACQLNEKNNDAEKACQLNEKDNDADKACQLTEEDNDADKACQLNEKDNDADKACQLTEEDNDADKACQLNEEDNDADKAFQLYIDLLFNLQNSEKVDFSTLISKIYYRAALYLYHRNSDASVLLKKAIECNPDNYKAVRLYGIIKPFEAKTFLSKSEDFSAKTFESFGDICYSNNDEENAIHYYSYASCLGELTASLKLGLIYFYSKTKEDLIKSIFYLSKIIEKKDENLKYYKIIAFRTLLKIRIKKGSIGIDQIKKYRCFKIDDNPNRIAEVDLDCYYEIGRDFISDENPKDYIIGLFCWQIAASLNHEEAKLNLGILYYEGKFILKDLEKATFLLQSISESNSKAQIFLGKIYYEKKDVKNSIDYYLRAANNKESEAQLFLGLSYIEGKIVQKDINKGFSYLNEASKSHDIKTLNEIGLFYINVNKKFALQCFEKGEAQNNPDSLFNHGSLLYEEASQKQANLNEEIEKEVEEAMEYFKRSSDQNHSKSQFFLGAIYYEGEYIGQDIQKAIHYFALSAAQNNCESQFCLGLIYYDGELIDKDMNKAIYYFSLAADQNNRESQFNLGVIYSESEDVKHDIEKAVRYFTLASNSNLTEANFKLGMIYKENLIKRDMKKAIHYLSLASSQSYPLAQFELGMIYYKGEYIDQDIQKAIHYFQLAAAQNNCESLFFLGLIYYDGELIEKDINKAILYLSSAADQNNHEAQYILGVIYSECEDVVHDSEKAVRYFTLASNSNLSKAAFKLGMIYYEGKLVEMDVNKGIGYLKLAASMNNEDAQNFLKKIRK